MSKPAKKHHAPVDGTAVNTGWTIKNARYNRFYGRVAIASEQGQKADKRVRHEISEGNREPVKVPAMF